MMLMSVAVVVVLTLATGPSPGEIEFIEENMDSITIRRTGGEVRISLPSPDWDPIDNIVVGVCHVPRLLVGEEAHDKEEDASDCPGDIVILSDVSDDASGHGVVATGSELISPVVNDTLLTLQFFHSKFYAFQSEKLTVVLREQLFVDGKFQEICKGGGHTGSDTGHVENTHHSTTPSKCVFDGFVLGERRRLPGDEVWEEIRVPVAICFLIVGASLALWRPHLAALRAGHAFARVSLLHHTLTCPRDRLIPEEFDYVLSPLQLSVGDTVDNTFIGMLLGNIIIIFSLVVITAIITTVVYYLKRVSVLNAICLVKASWVLIPMNILSGGAMYSAVACFLYATPGWRCLGAFISIICLVFLAVTHTMTKRVGFGRDTAVMECVEQSSEGTPKVTLFEGNYKWQTLDEEAAHEFNHLLGFLVSPMKQRYRYFPFFDLGYTLFVAVLQGWSPSLEERCVVRSAFLAFVPLIWGLVVFWHFPFISLFDNLCEVVLSGLISVMMVCTFATHLTDPDPYTWGVDLNPPTFAGWAAVVSEVVIFLKLMVDEVLFVRSRFKIASLHTDKFVFPFSLFAVPKQTCPSLCWDCVHLFRPSPKRHVKDISLPQASFASLTNVLSKEFPRMSSVHFVDEASGPLL